MGLGGGFWLGVSKQVMISVSIGLLIDYEIQEYIMHSNKN